MAYGLDLARCYLFAEHLTLCLFITPEFALAFWTVCLRHSNKPCIQVQPL